MIKYADLYKTYSKRLDAQLKNKHRNRNKEGYHVRQIKMTSDLIVVGNPMYLEHFQDPTGAKSIGVYVATIAKRLATLNADGTALLLINNIAIKPIAMQQIANFFLPEANRLVYEVKHKWLRALGNDVVLPLKETVPIYVDGSTCVHSVDAIKYLGDPKKLDTAKTTKCIDRSMTSMVNFMRLKSNLGLTIARRLIIQKAIATPHEIAARVLNDRLSYDDVISLVIADGWSLHSDYMTPDRVDDIIRSVFPHKIKSMFSYIATLDNQGK